jgi:hypothetical protein
MKDNVKIDWSYSGKNDYAFGNGATKTEKIIGWSSCFIVLLFMVYAIINKTVEWNIFQIIISILVAFDVGGGMICNSLNSCKRFYHSDKGDKSLMKNHMLFSLIHIHSIIVWAIFDNANWFYGLIWYGIFIVFVVSIIKIPLYLKRPISMICILFSIMINIYIIPSPKMFEWLIPVLFIKVLYGHLVREEPYRP